MIRISKECDFIKLKLIDKKQAKELGKEVKLSEEEIKDITNTYGSEWNEPTCVPKEFSQQKLITLTSIVHGRLYIEQIQAFINPRNKKEVYVKEELWQGR